MNATVESRPAAVPLAGTRTRYGELLSTLFRREVRARYQGSVLGLLWSVLYPLAMMAVYTLVFSVLWRATRTPHYPLFVLSGLAVWTFFSGSIQLAAASLVRNGSLIKQVWFPRAIIPAATVLAQGVTALVIFFVLVPIDLVVVPETRPTAILAIPMLAALLALTLGFAWILSVATVFFRDVDHLLGVLLLPWFFLTPILYGLDQLPAIQNHPALVYVLRYANPITPYVEGIRAVVLQGVVPGPALLLYIFVVGPALALVGLWVTARWDDHLAVEL